MAIQTKKSLDVKDLFELSLNKELVQTYSTYKLIQKF